MKFTMPNLKEIDFNHVTRYSQLIAIVLFVAVFALGFELGKFYEYKSFMNSINANITAATSGFEIPIDIVNYSCDGKKTIGATYWKNRVDAALSDGRHLTLPQVISGSGARYANKDESIVFWNKGNTAFVTEGKDTTYANCVDISKK
jgi:membrane-bound inhibitor of C-type lysozyme